MKVVPQMQEDDDATLQPSPSMCIKDCKLLQQSQRFDVTAIVDSLSEVRSVNPTCEVVNVTIIDDSGADDMPGQLTFAFFMDLPRSKEDAATMNILQQSQEDGNKGILSFFALQGRKTDRGFSFEASSKRDFFLIQAEDDRAKHLETIVEDLQLIPQKNRDILQQSSYERRNYDNEHGVQTLCKLLYDLASTTDLQTLNEKPTLWQVNWVEVGWPIGEDLLKKDGSQLWFQTSLRDLSGQVINVWMNEKSALALSQLEDKEAFLQSFSEGNQLFPIMSAVKIIREVRASKDVSDVSQLAGTQSAAPLVSLVVVHAADQPLNEPPSKAVLEMIPMIRDLKDDTSAILPACLDMIQTSPHYAFTIGCTSIRDGSKFLLPCQKILALVQSSKNSKAENLGTGFKIITPDVEDLLSDVAEPKKHTLSAICTLDNLPQYRLDPPRAGTQAALVTVTAKTNASFVVESVQLLTSDQALQAKESLLKLLHMAMHIYSRDRKRTIEWTNNFSPMMARKCTRVGRSPTDAPLPEPC